MAAFHQVPSGEWEQLARVLDEGIGQLSGQQQALAVQRAQRRCGAVELDPRDDDHLRIVWDELRAAALRAALDRLVASGELEVAGVADSGHLVYRGPAATGSS